jgi:hypothetical protein
MAPSADCRGAAAPHLPARWQMPARWHRWLGTLISNRTRPRLYAHDPQWLADRIRRVETLAHRVRSHQATGYARCCESP